MNISIDDDQLSKIISAHLFESMSVKEREDLMKRAIEHVFSGQGMYGPNTRTIHDLFREVVREIVQKRLTEEAANPESLFRKMIDNALDTYFTELRKNPKPLIAFFESSLDAAIGAAVKNNRGW